MWQMHVVVCARAHRFVHRCMCGADYLCTPRHRATAAQHGGPRAGRAALHVLRLGTSKAARTCLFTSVPRMSRFVFCVHCALADAHVRVQLVILPAVVAPLPLRLALGFPRCVPLTLGEEAVDAVAACSVAEQWLRIVDSLTWTVRVCACVGERRRLMCPRSRAQTAFLILAGPPLWARWLLGHAVPPLCMRVCVFVCAVSGALRLLLFAQGSRRFGRADMTVACELLMARPLCVLPGLCVCGCCVIDPR